MAVAFVNSATGQESFSDTETFSLTVSAGDNRLLMVGVGRYNPAEAVSTVTFNGEALEEWADVTNPITTTFRTSVWYMVEPAVATANVVITMAASVDRLAALADVFTGVDQTTPLDTAVIDSGLGPDDATVAVSSATDDLVVDFFNCRDAATTIGADQTERAIQTNSPVTMRSSTEPGATSVTMSWSGIANFENFDEIGININAAGGGGAAGNAGRLLFADDRNYLMMH